MASAESEVMVETAQADNGKPVPIDRRIELELLATLAKLGGQRVQEDSLVFEGKRFILPETMTVKGAIKYLRQYEDAQEAETRFVRSFNYRPWDGAHALQSAFKKVFGMVGIGKATFSFFGGKQPPEMISIRTGVTETMQVPWGVMEVPLFAGTMYIDSIHSSEYGPLFTLVIECPKKFAAHVEGLFRAVEEELQVNSIYKGKALDGQVEAEFIDLESVDPTRMILSEALREQLEANLWAPLRYTESMRELRLPLKRAVLLEGPYGTGKSMAAFVTAQISTEHGWSFIYCRPGKDDLNSVMATARLYQPAVVFFEDVDTIASPQGPTSDSVSELLDLFDGIVAKGTELVVVMTTNHPERIHKGMVRPGRLDAVIPFRDLDRAGIEAIVKVLVPEDLLDPDIDFDVVAEAMEGYLPAFCKEAVDRAMRYAVARCGGRPDAINMDDLVFAAQGLRPQLGLMEGAKESIDKPVIESVIREQVAKAIDHTGLVQKGRSEPEYFLRTANERELSER